MRARWPIISGAGLPIAGALAVVVAVTHPAALPGATHAPSAPTRLVLGNPAVSIGGSDHGCDGDHDWDDQGCGGSTGGSGSSGGTGGPTSTGGTGSGGTGSVGGGLGATGSGGSGITGSGGGNPDPPHCYSGTWPISWTPIPPGSVGGVYLRSDGAGLYLEVTHRGGRTVVYSGTLTSDGTLSADPYKLESQDHFSSSPDGHTLTFRFVNHGALDGMAITATCGQSVTLQADSGRVPSRLVYVVGRSTGQRAQSLNVPVTITRTS